MGLGAKDVPEIVIDMMDTRINGENSKNSLRVGIYIYLFNFVSWTQAIAIVLIHFLNIIMIIISKHSNSCSLQGSELQAWEDSSVYSWAFA